MLTFGTGLEGGVLEHLVSLTKLTNNAPILLVDKDDFPARVLALRPIHVALPGGKVAGVIWRKLLLSR